MFEEKVVEINNKDNYYVLKQTIYNNRVYLLANELDNHENPTEIMAILRVEKIGNDLKIFLENDGQIISCLFKIFEQMI